MKWSYLDTALLVVVSYHLINSPYTKVEESFNIQAIHDILKYGIWDISKYDHLQFPGVVPRTFIGALLVSILTNPFITISKLFSKPSTDISAGFETQILVRSIIGLTNAASLIYLKNALQSTFDNCMRSESEQNGKNSNGNSDSIKHFSGVGKWFLLFVMTSFHLMFYATRPLPNFIMTLPLVNLSFGLILYNKLNWALALLTFTSIVFRLEVSALTLGVFLFSYYYNMLNGLQSIRFALMGASLGAFLSIIVDSYFWRDWTLPEIDAFIFNVISGKASNWGTEPFIAYFTHYLRMLFIPPTILLLNYLGFRFAPNNLKIVTLASYFHIFIMSFQPHKEWRFIVYSIPPIIMLGSTAASYLWENIRVQNLKNALLLSLLPLSALIAGTISLLFSKISSMNYPGGEALAKFNQYIVDNNVTNAKVHISVPPCMTGVTLFGQLESPLYNITYDKTEDWNKLESEWSTFDYIITHQNDPEQFPFQFDQPDDYKWELIQTTKMFTHIDLKFIRSHINQFIKNNEGKELGRIFFDNIEKFPTLLYKMVTTQCLANVFNETFNRTFIQNDVFYIYKKVRQ